MAEGLRLFPPMRWKFADPDDVAQYGDGWWTWDERGLARMRGRELIALEAAVDMAVPAIIRGLREDDTAANLAAMWISMHLAGHDVDWPSFNPMVLTAEWELAPDVPLESGGDPTPDSGSSEATPPSSEFATS